MPSYVYDAIIALVVAGVPLWLWQRAQRKAPVIESGLVSLAASLSGLLWVVVVYGSFVEPHLLVTREHDVTLDPTSSYALRIAVISDTHLGIYKHEAWLARVVRRINAEQPDLVLIAGDIVSNAAGMEQLAPLADLEPRYGTFAALGNWDYRVGAVDVRHAVERYGVEVLTNESVRIETGGPPLRLIGLDDLKYGMPDWDSALTQRRPGETTILLVHEPDFALGAEVRGIDLTIAGHTHGGQIRIPFIGAVPPLPTGMGRHFDKGLFPIGPSKLFITSGVGESGPRARLADFPEVSILNLTY